MKSLFTLLADQIAELWKQVQEESTEMGFLPLLRPVAPYDPPALLSPLAMLGVLLGLVVTSGLAIASLGMLLLALLGLYLLLTEVLGITIELRPA